MKISRMHKQMVWVLLAVVFAVACSEEDKPATSATAAAAVAAPTEVTVTTVTREELFDRKMRALAAENTRSVFRQIELISSKVGGGGTSPLESFELAQLGLVGVIWNIAKPVALIRTPEGKEYPITINQPMGKNGGRVISILSDQVLVEEKFYDFRGELQQTKHRIKLPAHEGDK